MRLLGLANWAGVCFGSCFLAIGIVTLAACKRHEPPSETQSTQSVVPPPVPKSSAELRKEIALQPEDEDEKLMRVGEVPPYPIIDLKLVIDHKELSLQRSELESSLRTTLGDEDVAALMKYALPTARMTFADDVDIAIGASKYGGDADVPEGFAWPFATADRSRKPVGLRYPLTFVAQINFAEVSPLLNADSIWPKDGTLVFFFDSVCAPAGEVAKTQYESFLLKYFPAGTPLRRTAAPKGQAPIPSDASKFVLPQRRLKFEAGYTLFDIESDESGAITDREAYLNWYQEVIREDESPKHRVGGYAYPEQWDPRERCRFNSTGQGKPEWAHAPFLTEADGPWRLVFQFDFYDQEDLACAFGNTQFFVCASEASIRSRSFQSSWWYWDQD